MRTDMGRPSSNPDADASVARIRHLITQAGASDYGVFFLYAREQLA
jgi:hypothetical protein